MTVIGQCKLLKHIREDITMNGFVDDGALLVSLDGVFTHIDTDDCGSFQCPFFLQFLVISRNRCESNSTAYARAKSSDGQARLTESAWGSVFSTLWESDEVAFHAKRCNECPRP